MKVTIKGKEIELKQTIRALMMYENIEGKSFNPQGITDMITYFYCTVLASSGDYSISFDDFLDELDNNSELVKEFSDWLTGSESNQNKLKKE